MNEHDPKYNPELQREPGEECLATWWHQATPGTTYWRCLVPARHLPGQTLPISPKDLAETEEGVIYMPRQRGDVAVWQFLGDEARSKIAVNMRHLHGTRTLMEVDDNYTRMAPWQRHNPSSPWKQTKAEANGAYSNEGHREVAPLMDGIICATEYLGDVYSEYNENVYVCPNSVDADDWQFDREEHDCFRIVYYGSPSHARDTPLLTKALKWAARQPGVEIWTVGFDPTDWSFPHQSVPWTQDLTEARKSLFSFDLGLAPLKGDPWARGKSDVKALEYAMAGVLPLTSDEVPFQSWKPYFPDLVLSDDDWLPAIRWAIANQDDVRDRAADAKTWVLENREIRRTVGAWREALGV